MSGSGSRRDSNTKPPKVVIINTQYVETDAKGFKDLVQKLTGKDSKVEDDGDDVRTAWNRWSDQNSKSESSRTSSGTHRTLMRDISFKDFERLLRDMPPIDEMWPPVDN